MLRLTVWGGTFVVVVAGCFLNLCFKSVPDPSKYWPEKWVSVQSLKPEVRGWVEAQYIHPCAFAVRAVRHYDYTKYLPLLVVSLVTLERQVMTDLFAAQTRLNSFEHPCDVRLEDLLLAMPSAVDRQWELNRLLSNGAIVPLRYRALRQRYVVRVWKEEERSAALQQAGYGRTSSLPESETSARNDSHPMTEEREVSPTRTSPVRWRRDTDVHRQSGSGLYLRV